MPPTVRFTRDAVLHAACQLMRREGMEALNARAIAKELGGSTQPIFRLFTNMEDLHRELILYVARQFQAHAEADMAQSDSPYIQLCTTYLLYGRDEPELFKLLFMRDRSGEEKSDGETEDVKKSVELIMKGTGLGMNDAFMLHLEMWIFVHGIASMIATSYLNWESELVSRMVSDAYEGIKARFISKDGKEDKNVR